MTTVVDHILRPSDLSGLHGRLKGWVSLDIETRNDKGSLSEWDPGARIVCVSFTTEPGLSWVVPLSHPAADWSGNWRGVAAELFEACRGRLLVGANLKFDVRWIWRHTGVDLTPHMAWDIVSAAHLLNENESHGLKAQAVKYLGVEPWDKVDLTDAEQVEWDELSLYNGLDTDYTLRLCWKQRDLLRPRPLGKLFWHVVMPAERALTRVEHTGLLLDEDRVIDRKVRVKSKATVLREELDDLAAKDRTLWEKHTRVPAGPRKPERYKDFGWGATALAFKEYAEKRWPVLERTDKGAPSWGESVLTRLAAKGYEDAGKLLEYRKLTHQLTSFLTRWPNDTDDDGRIHATYNVSGTATGRLSCSKPNLQQVDRNLKGCFRAPKGWRFVSCDYSQLEVRIAAHVSEDDNLRAVFREGRDVYVETAAHAFNRKPEDVTKDDRQRAKPIVLGFLYGMGAKNFGRYARDSYGVDFTLAESEAVREAFFDLFPRLRWWHAAQRVAVRNEARAVSELGRIRRLPEVHSSLDRAKIWSAERQGINAPIQSFASDIMLMSLARVSDFLDEVRIVGTVHDSMLLEAEYHQDMGDNLDRVAQIMLNPPLERFGVTLSVPLAVDIEVGDRWGEPDTTISVRGKTLQEASS